MKREPKNERSGGEGGGGGWGGGGAGKLSSISRKKGNLKVSESKM